MYKGVSMRFTADFLPKTMETRGQWDDYRGSKKNTVNQEFYI
jgi:hypothetical protein